MSFHQQNKLVPVILLFFLSLVVTGCKKETTSSTPDTSEETTVAPIYTETTVPCELCAYADSLEGTYGGIGAAHLGFNAGFDGGGYDGPQDSVYVQLKHVFKPNLNSMVDSIHMFIEVRSWIKNDSQMLIDTLSLLDRTGAMHDGSYQSLKIFYDSVSINYLDYQFPESHTINYKGYRLP